MERVGSLKFSCNTNTDLQTPKNRDIKTRQTITQSLTALLIQRFTVRSENTATAGYKRRLKKKQGFMSCYLCLTSTGIIIIIIHLFFFGIQFLETEK